MYMLHVIVATHLTLSRRHGRHLLIMLDLEASRCACQLDALYYIPHYYTEEEERQLLTTISSSQTKWVQV
jgi:hypothetical protein